MPRPDWRQRIAIAALPALTENGCVLVSYDGVRPAETVSRLYKTADYLREHGYKQRGSREVAARQQSRMLNEGAGHVYVVQRHDGGVTVWTGLHHMLIDVPTEALAALT